MTEPTKEVKIRIGGLEITTTIAGLAVVIGLVMESSSDIYRSWAIHTLPSKELWGGLLVALGVFVEVMIGIFIARSSKREQIESNERMAQAEKATAEANLARAKIEQRMKMRVIEQGVREDLIKLLTQWGSGRVDIVIFDHHIRKRNCSRTKCSLFSRLHNGNARCGKLAARNTGFQGHPPYSL